MTHLDTVLDVSGMSCPSCVRHVTAALGPVPGVSKIDVQLKAGTVSIRHAPDAAISTMLEALREAGYEAKLREAQTRRSVQAQ
jgi:copper chaperone